MKASYPASIAAVLVHEGGFVNDRRDPGGTTNKGVTQAVYDDWRKDHGLVKQSVRLIAEPELADIYKRRYWDAVRGDDLPAGLDYAVFDFAVNSGPDRAARFLQSALGVAHDGKIGPITLAAAAKKPKFTINLLCDARLNFLRSLGTFAHFGKGWTARVKEVRAKALGMAA